MTDQTLLSSIVILAIGIFVGAWLTKLYRSGDAGIAQAQEASIQLSPEDSLRLHWLAINGFTRLMIIGERDAAGGFRERSQAEDAHWTLERLEHQLPQTEISGLDYALDREGDIGMRWTSDPLSPPQQMLKQWRLDREP